MTKFAIRITVGGKRRERRERREEREEREKREERGEREGRERGKRCDREIERSPLLLLLQGEFRLLVNDIKTVCFYL